MKGKLFNADEWMAVDVKPVPNKDWDGLHALIRCEL
jgi:hypothetical protein